MSNPPVAAPDQPSLSGRLRRELRNPSMLSVILIVVAVTAVPLALLVPSWVATTQKSFQDRSASDAIRDASLVSSNVLVPSQIAPWMLDQIERMEDAKSLAEWNFTSFNAGPCDSNNLSQLPAGPFADAIADSCTRLGQIQADHAAECRSIQVCDVSDQAIGKLISVRVDLLDAFSEADLVLPYSREEEPSK